MARRGGFPGGMPGNMTNLMKQAQRMQKSLRRSSTQQQQAVELYPLPYPARRKLSL